MELRDHEVQQEQQDHLEHQEKPVLMDEQEFLDQ